MSKKTDSIWNRLLKAVLPAAIQAAPPLDVDRNTNTLARLEENDPVLACVRDHAVAQFGNELTLALDRTAPAAVRLAALDSASGLRLFLEDLEYRRQGWNEERIRALRAAQKTEEAA